MDCAERFSTHDRFERRRRELSVYAGRTWTPQTFSTAHLYHVITTRHVPYHACGAQQDNTTVCVPSNGRGASFYPVGGGESGYAGNPGVTSAADRLSAALTDIEGHLYQYRNRSTKDPLNFPPQLDNKFGSLPQVVDSGDAPPTDAAYAVFEELSAKLSEQLAALDKLLGRDVADFNRLITAASLPIIQVD